MTIAAPTRADLALLEAKYAEILALRQARDRGEPIPEKQVFKTLAERFPGALRELDTLPLDVVEARQQALQSAAQGGVIEPWMAWMLAYHGLMRAALSIKLRTAKQRDVTDERAAFLARSVTAVGQFVVDEQFVVEVMRPRSGRLNAVVMERIAVMYGVPAHDVRDVLFPRRRR